MFDCRCNDVLALSAAAARAENRGIGRLCAAGSKGNFRRLGVENRRHMAARSLYNAGCFDSHFMYAGRVAELLGHHLTGERSSLRQDGSCRRMIQIMHDS